MHLVPAPAVKLMKSRVLSRPGMKKCLGIKLIQRQLCHSPKKSFHRECFYVTGTHSSSFTLTIMKLNINERWAQRCDWLSRSRQIIIHSQEMTIDGWIPERETRRLKDLGTSWRLQTISSSMITYSIGRQQLMTPKIWAWKQRMKSWAEKRIDEGK